MPGCRSSVAEHRQLKLVLISNGCRCFFFLSRNIEIFLFSGKAVVQKHSWYLRPHLQFKCKLDRLLADESADWSISWYFSTE